MRVMSALRAVSMGALLLVPSAALASHGKVGLWQITTTTGGMAAAIPPQVRAQMKAHGVSMPDSRTFVTQHCMSAEEVATDTPPPQHGCSTSKVVHGGGHFAADVQCSGRMAGHGHFEVSYDSPEHYRGHMVMQIGAGGHDMKINSQFKGRWLKTDCGSVTH